VLDGDEMVRRGLEIWIFIVDGWGIRRYRKVKQSCGKIADILKLWNKKNGKAERRKVIVRIRVM